MNRRNFLKGLGIGCVAPVVFIPKLIEVPRWKVLRDSTPRHGLTTIIPEHIMILLDRGIIRPADFKNSKHFAPIAMDMGNGKSRTSIVKSGVIEGESFNQIIIDDIITQNGLSAEEMRERHNEMWKLHEEKFMNAWGKQFVTGRFSGLSMIKELQKQQET